MKATRLSECCFYLYFLLIDFREKGRAGGGHGFVVPLIYALVGCFLCAPRPQPRHIRMALQPTELPGQDLLCLLLFYLKYFSNILFPFIKVEKLLRAVADGDLEMVSL